MVAVVESWAKRGGAATIVRRSRSGPKNSVFGVILEKRFGEDVFGLVLEVGMYCDLRGGLGENIVKLLTVIPTGKQFLHRRIYFPAITAVNLSAEIGFGVRPFARGYG